MFVFIKRLETFVEYPVSSKIININFIDIFVFFFIKDVGYNMYKKNYEAPKQSEGLEEIIQIDFVPKFDSDEHEKIFHYYTES